MEVGETRKGNVKQKEYDIGKGNNAKESKAKR